MANILHKGHSDDGLMRGEGEFEMFQTGADLQNQLANICQAGRICYRSDKGNNSRSDNNDFINMLMQRGHHSVIEHSSLTVILSNVSRGVTHELVRHRLCGYSQESTRFCDYAGGQLDLEAAGLVFIYPPHKEITYDSVALSIPQQLVDNIEYKYKKLRRDGWSPQDARQFLPIGIASKIAITTNFREWRHIFAMRTQKAAHWEIRYVMCDLLTMLKERIPVIFRDFVNIDEDGSLLRDSQGYGYYRQLDYWPEEGE